MEHYSRARTVEERYRDNFGSGGFGENTAERVARAAAERRRRRASTNFEASSSGFDHVAHCCSGTWMSGVVVD